MLPWKRKTEHVTCLHSGQCQHIPFRLAIDLVFGKGDVLEVDMDSGVGTSLLQILVRRPLKEALAVNTDVSR
jgi:hypothetical protein